MNGRRIRPHADLSIRMGRARIAFDSADKRSVNTILEHHTFVIVRKNPAAPFTTMTRNGQRRMGGAGRPSAERLNKISAATRLLQGPNDRGERIPMYSRILG